MLDSQILRSEILIGISQNLENWSDRFVDPRCQLATGRQHCRPTGAGAQLDDFLPEQVETGYSRMIVGAIISRRIRHAVVPDRCVLQNGGVRRIADVTPRLRVAPAPLV